MLIFDTSVDYSQADDDDLDDLSFGGPPQTHKPSTSASNAQGSQPGLSGRIGQDPNTRTRNEAWGGIRMETRYTGESTLDEPVSKTIVSDVLDDDWRGAESRSAFRCAIYFPSIPSCCKSFIRRNKGARMNFFGMLKQDPTTERC